MISLTKLSLGENYDVIYKLFPPRERLVSDIPAGDGNIEKLYYGVYTVKKASDIPVPSRDVTYRTLPGWKGIIKLFPPRGSLVSNIPAGDGGMLLTFFYGVHLHHIL